MVTRSPRKSQKEGKRPRRVVFRRLAVVCLVGGAALVGAWFVSGSTGSNSTENATPNATTPAEASPTGPSATEPSTTEPPSTEPPNTESPSTEPSIRNATPRVESETRRATAVHEVGQPATKQQVARQPAGSGDDGQRATDESDPTSIADQLGPVDRGAAIPPTLEPRLQPAGLQISTLDVSTFPIRAIGLLDDGQLEVPDETEIGWYQYGATADQPGATVLAAHVSWNQAVGPFFELDTVEPGAQIELALDDGTVRRYEVTERARYGKDELPRERVWRTSGAETLVLITCGGDFNPEIRRYQHNIVVFASPID